MSRILMVSSLWPPDMLGGAEAYAAQLAEHLRQRGHAVGAFTGGVVAEDVVGVAVPRPYRLDDYDAQSRARRAEFHVRDVYRTSSASALAASIASFRPDVVHSHAIAGLSTAALTVPTRCGVAHVHTLHDYWLRCERSTLVRRDGTPCATRCVSCVVFAGARALLVARHPPDVVLAVSQAIAQAHAPIRWLAARTRVLYNPVGDEPRPRRVPSGPPTFGFLGRLTVEKGVRTLVAAFADADLPPGSRLLVAGDGPLSSELAGASSEGVVMLGRVDVAGRERLLDDVHALVVPSEWPDPAPLVVNEARARRVPVIGSTAGGIPELVSPTCRPLLFGPGDARALADRLVEVALDPGSFVADSRDGLLEWPDHVDGVLEAYAAAREHHP
jgi:glycosyltransferase involved in cell wall biosynthesis